MEKILKFIEKKTGRHIHYFVAFGYKGCFFKCRCGLGKHGEGWLK